MASSKYWLFSNLKTISPGCKFISVQLGHIDRNSIQGNNMVPQQACWISNWGAVLHLSQIRFHHKHTGLHLPPPTSVYTAIKPPKRSQITQNARWEILTGSPRYPFSVSESHLSLRCPRKIRNKEVKVCNSAVQMAWLQCCEWIQDLDLCVWWNQPLVGVISRTVKWLIAELAYNQQPAEDVTGEPGGRGRRLAFMSNYQLTLEMWSPGNTPTGDANGMRILMWCCLLYLEWTSFILCME